PKYSFTACAWATFFCYGSMMVLSFVWGQQEYRIPYAWKKLTAYMIIVVLLYFLHKGISHIFPGNMNSIISGLILLALYLVFILKVEKKEFQRLPFIGKYI